MSTARRNHPLFATEKTAAKLLELSTSEFMKLVEDGALPPAVTLAPGVRRWEVARLEGIVNGNFATGEFEW